MGWPVLVSIQHNTPSHRTWVCHTWMLVEFDGMFESVIKHFLHIKERVCFVLDLMQALWKKRPDLAAHIENVVLHQDNAPCHTSMNTLLEIDVLGFQRDIHQSHSSDLAPLDFVYFHYLKSYLRVTRFNKRTKISHAIQTCNRSLDRAWFMNVYQTKGEMPH